ncbi:hypothetical protein AGABI1DRAFT_85824 [Agaricus bisporus var. burnettii JB137-S8]|uniref:Methanethiol oxidase n=1 Tax=Agaricus bisporus var. burnettii (strain JB137-S8 / ATCC MYA-4627 / FGSC 10392) TaxID=597362 RepID=K5X7L0_AGABU|nr:uncharacterized protein AGABI1DRAFT_85824 [Agaricus bisporus var. burnettii JB137-S8]EKM78972.1 hypothetical protein AGABI1DRAFT_85824 [Agaricus bisporus var. burnettii JB137-S8]
MPAPGIELGRASGESVGAAYFATNNPNGNFIVASDIGSDGKVTLRRAYDAGGIGVHGIQNPPVADSLFSQGSTKTSAVGDMVALVNAGSNTIALFKINPDDPTDLRMIGEPVCSGGEFPVSLVFNKAGDMLCVANGGAVDGINCFTVDQKEGLKPKDDLVRPMGLNQTTPATGPFGTAGMISFTEDESQLVVAVKGAPPDMPGFLAFWDMKDGCPSTEYKRLDPVKGAIAPFSATVMPGKNAIMSADPGIGYTIWDLADLNDGGSGTASRSSANVVEGQIETCWSNYSPSTGNYILVDANMSFISEVSVDENLKGTVITHIQRPDYPRIIDFDIGTINNHDYVYVLGPNATVFDVLSLDGPGITPIQRIQLWEPAQRAGLMIDNNHMQGMALYFKK